MPDLSASPPAGASRPWPARLLKPRSRRGRWLRRGVVLLALLAGGAWGVLRGPGAKWIVMPRLREALGPGASAERVAIHLDGSATIRGLTLPARGVPGAAGEAVRLDACRVALRRDAGGRLADLTIDGGRVRISQDLQTGVLNLGALEVLGMEPTASSTRLRVTLRGLRLEVGEHERAEYHALKAITVDGTLTPAAEPGRANFHLTERAEGARAPLDVQGSITPDGATAELRGLDMHDWPATVIPSRVRGVYAQLDVAGEVGRTVLVLHDGGRIEARTILRGVDVSLPFDLEGTMRPTGPLARMRGVEGEIVYDGAGVSARLSGKLEDFPYEADLRYEGTTADAPFLCTLRTRGYHLTREAPLVPYAPDVVAERLRTFTQPTGILDADVIVERRNRPDGTAGPVDVSGTIDVRDAVASFINFPYEFRQMRGRFRFDNSVVLVESIEGVAPSGARLFASGGIAPPVDDGRVDLHVRVEGVPLDETLRAGLRGRAHLYDALFSEERRQELAGAGLLDDDGPGAFVPGGTCDVDVYVTRELGGDSIWDYLVGVQVPEADLLPQRFPYPVRARDVLLRVGPERAEVIRGSFFGLRGGEASIGARAELDDSSDVALRVIGRGFPIDDLLVHAAADATGHDPAEWTRLARELGLDGRANPDIFVRVGDDQSITLGGVVEGRDLLSAPAPGSPSLVFEGALDLGAMVAHAAGRIEAPGASPPGVRPDVLSVPAAPELGDPGGLAPAPSTFGASFTFGEHANTVEATITSLDLALALEDLLRPLAPEAADELAALRSDIDPRGWADLHALITLPEGAEPRAEVELSPREIVSIDSDFGRVALHGSQGHLRLSAGSLEAHTLTGRLAIDGRPAAWVELDGALRGETPGVTLLARQIDLSHPAWATIAGLSAGAESAGALRDLALRGEASGSLALAPDARGDWQVRSGTLRPEWITFARRGADVSLASMGGSLDYTVGEPLAFTLSGRAPQGDWNLRASGAAWLSETPARVEASLEVDAAELIPQLRALLPQSVDDALGALNLRATGLHLDLPALALSWDDSGQSTRARGLARFDDASCDVGIEIEHARGLAAFVLEPGTPPEVRLELTHARAAGLTLEHTLARVTQDEGGTTAEFEADAHAGRISGDARLFDEDDRYEADVKFAGVLLGPLLRDLEAQPDEEGLAAEASSAQGALARDDARTGRVSGELSLTGTLGDVASRRGRGRLLVGEGRVLDMPLVLPLLKVGNLQLPTRGTIDLAMASIYLDGSLLTFDELSAFADSVEIFGYGTMTLPGRELDLWFNSRALRPIPIVSTLVESLRRGLVTARVTGPLGEQKVSTDALPGTRAFLDRLFTGPASPEEQHLARIEARSRENRDRVRRAGERVRRLAEASPTEGTSP